jgi:catechol 2,3-dioxygenase-like lactoylglutathione lyase family enzyme
MTHIDHVGLVVADLDRARAFYTAALAPFGIRVLMEVTQGGGHVGFGDMRPFFWISGGAGKSGGTHVAFAAASRALVDAFHQAALTAGGTDNGAPGLRPHYHPSYYGAFVLDLDGHNTEAVCHGET